MSWSWCGSKLAGHGALSQGTGLRRPSREPSHEADPGERERDGAARPVAQAGWREKGESEAVEVANHWSSGRTRAPMVEGHWGGVVRSWPHGQADHIEMSMDAGVLRLVSGGARGAAA